MDGLKQLIGLAPARSSFPPVETDDVYPVHMLDDTKTLRDIVIAWTLRFNDVLDAEKLHGSLSRLLEIGDWRKAGGRLRLRVGSLLFAASNGSLLTLTWARRTENWRFMSQGNSVQNALR